MLLFLKKIKVLELLSFINCIFKYGKLLIANDMNKLLSILVILISSLIYSLLWNGYRKPYCPGCYSGGDITTSDVAQVPSASEDGNYLAESVEAVDETVTDASEELPAPKADLDVLVIYFDSGKADFTRDKSINDWLSDAQKAMEVNKDTKLRIIGYSDSSGTQELNDRLSQQRAKSVATALVARGFENSRMVVEGRGISEPIDDNATPEGRAKNRRVTIVLE